MTYELAPKMQGEGDSNLDLMNRWERAQGMKMSQLTRDEWVDVASHILVLTKQEAEAYLNSLIARNL